MPTPLTSWKEIAQYLGKGVRTVQRWERDMGLPVRRPQGRDKGVVFALAEDIDDWLHQQHTTQSDNLKCELGKLRSALSEAVAENDVLRRELKSDIHVALKKAATNTYPQNVLERSAQLERDFTTAKRMFKETIEMSRALRRIRPK